MEITRPPKGPNSGGFFNQKRLTINVQVVAGPDLKLYGVIASWPGSTHDSRVFKNSALQARLEMETNAMLLRLFWDKEYSSFPCLMTPSYPAHVRAIAIKTEKLDQLALDFTYATGKIPSRGHG